MSLSVFCIFNWGDVEMASPAPGQLSLSSTLCLKFFICTLGNFHLAGRRSQQHIDVLQITKGNRRLKPDIKNALDDAEPPRLNPPLRISRWRIDPQYPQAICISRSGFRNHSETLMPRNGGETMSEATVRSANVPEIAGQ
jgi:hypothetical protein